MIKTVKYFIFGSQINDTYYMFYTKYHLEYVYHIGVVQFSISLLFGQKKFAQKVIRSIIDRPDNELSNCRYISLFV